MQKCGGLIPNDLGLFDMLGNAYEWCQDRYVPTTPTRLIPTGADIVDETYRLLRGGSYADLALTARSASRRGIAQPDRGVNAGFRLARTLD
jgi:formylglycine-generating enzyme required for sulfatase activity